MSGNIIFASEETGKLVPKELAGIYGHKAELYWCNSPLEHYASVKRYLGEVKDTIEHANEQRGSLELAFDDIQKDPPAVRIVDKGQEVHALTFQKWKGVVKDISEKTFVGQLTDLLANVPEEQAEFFRDDIQEDDKDLLAIGAVFYWHIGYVYSSSNQVTRASFLRFQRLPLYNRDGVEMAKKKAEDIRNNITWL